MRAGLVRAEGARAKKESIPVSRQAGRYESLRQQSIIASRLLEYEVWNRINARKLTRSHGEMVRALIGRIALIELLYQASDPMTAFVKASGRRP